MRFHAMFAGYTMPVERARRASARRRPANRRSVIDALEHSCLLCFEALEDRYLLSFSPAVNYPAGTSTNVLLTADFNGDGRLDIAAVSNISSDVNVLLGNADGTFQTAQNSASGAPPLALAVGDFNVDGKLDLATANAGNVNVLLGNGNGTFQAPTGIDIGSSPTSVAVGDFNADGKLDLGVTSNVYYPGGCYYSCYPGFYAGRAHVLLGNGAGSFSAPNTTSIGSGYYSSAVVADFNGDGRQDFAASDVNGIGVSILLGTGTGTLGSPTVFTAGANPRLADAGDVNGDGKRDLVTANTGGGTVSVLLGTGTGSFGAAQSYAAGPAPSSVAVADFNGDGKADLVTANAGSSAVSVLLGTGTGAFKLPLDANAGAGQAGVVVGDFNRDGRLDATSANPGTNTVSVLLNNRIWPELDAPLIAIGDVTVTEGNTGTVNAVFTVSLSAAYGQAVAVHYATADGSATLDGGDYQPASDTLTFAPGATSMTVSVPVNGDRLAETSEFFQVRLNDPTNAFVADATSVGTIMDDEPQISISDVTLTEGNAGTTIAVFRVSLGTVYDEPVSVNFSTVEGDTEAWFGYDYYGNYYPPPPAATAGSDFQAQTGSVTIGRGDTSQEIRVGVNGDRLAEDTEYFAVDLSDDSGSATIIDRHGVGAIVNDEPYVSINSTSGVEGNAGTTFLTFTVSLSAASDAPVTVSYATADGSATIAGADYQAKTDSLTFGIGQTSTTVAVLVNGDRLGENDESFAVNLTGATGALISTASGYGTIQDNETRLSINSVIRKEGRKGARQMTFAVTLSGAYDQPVTVNFATQDGSATVAGNDYAAKSGSLTFAAGEATKTITVTIKGDKKREFTEDFYVLLSGASTNAIISNTVGSASIRNDDGRRR